MIAPLIIVALLTVSIDILFKSPGIPTGILTLMNLYRIVNIWRLVEARVHERYLQHITVQTSIWIISFQVVLMLLWQITSWLNVSTYHFWSVMVSFDLIIVLILLRTTVRHLRKTNPPPLPGINVSDSDLPTITVAIPARNETTDLESCLQSLISSDYPKLEILVLDDSSQNKRTPEIIRSFAHDGVIFIQGSEPEVNWLAKNQAYQRLFEEANGDLIVFCGVDVQFQINSLRQLVNTMLYKNKTMLSIIPKNTIIDKPTHHDSALLQPFRYAWELVLPRKLFHRAPVLSSCWIIKREILVSAGGFGAVSRSIIPESYFAHVCAVHDGYSFMQSNNLIGITSHKCFDEQLATAIRTRYPQLHRRMELVLLTTLVELFVVIMPFALIVASLLGYVSLQLTIVSIITVLILTLIYILIVRLTYRKWLLRSVILLPIAILIDVALLNYSMYRYEFSIVIWKDRNISIPIMHTSDLSPSMD